MATLTLKRLHCARIVLGKSGSSSEDPDVPVIPPSSEYATVTFVPGGDMDDMEIQVEIGTTISEIPAPTREGWEFQGWWSAEVGGIELDPSQPVQESATYYGHWTLIESPITYNMNGHGSVPEDALLVNSVAKMEDYTPPNPEPVEGWTFAGWNPASIAVENCSAVTFTAQWVENGTDIPEEPEDVFSQDPEMQEAFGDIDERYPLPENIPPYSEVLEISNELPEYAHEQVEASPVDDILAEDMGSDDDDEGFIPWDGTYDTRILPSDDEEEEEIPDEV